ncbi:MAG: shikimate dehydrogenase [Thaumarchaeota archaeon]|nr:shikimate dehydrogenase [Nitrososphaerota archaeon]
MNKPKRSDTSRGKNQESVPRFFLLGSGIGKSISPPIHQRAFRELGMIAEYGLLDIVETELERKLKETRESREIAGFNVTIPYKEKIVPFIAVLDSQASLVGAVNTVRFDNGRNMEGFNTDIDGVIASLSKLGLTGGDTGKKAVVLGAGGAARACIYACLANGFDEIVILNRTEARAHDLAGETSAKFPRTKLVSRELSKTQFDECVAGTCDLLINTIPQTVSLPFHTKFETAPLSMKYFDLNYRGGGPLMKAAIDLNFEAIDGLLMLVEQAARSFEIWTGISAPRKMMMLEAKSLVARKSK